MSPPTTTPSPEGPPARNCPLERGSAATVHGYPLRVLVAVLIFALVAAIFVISAVITWKKGRRSFFWLGFLLGGAWMVAAFRLARPTSPWARRFYSPAKMELAQQRYEEPVAA